MSKIKAGTTSGTALVTEGDTTGQLVFQTNGTTTALTLGTDQSATFAGPVSVPSPLAVAGNATAGAEIRLPEDTDNGSNYVALKAPNALAANLTLTLPTADGTSGQVLQTNGAGQLSFATPSAGAMTLLTTVTPTVSAYVTLSNLFTSTYDTYFITGQNIRFNANNAALYYELLDGTGSPITSDYANVPVSLQDTSFGASNGFVAGGPVSNSFGLNFSTWIYGVNTSSLKTSVNDASYVDGGNGNGAVNRTISMSKAATITGLRFRHNGTNTFQATGKIYVYGLKNS